MGVVFIDSFDHYATSQIPLKYDLRASDTIVSGGRDSTNCVNLSTEVAYVIRNLSSIGATVVMGAAMYPMGLGNSNEAILMGFRLSGSDQISIRATNLGVLTVCRNSTTPIGTTSYTYTTNRWIYVEMKVLLSTSATGTVDVRVNGQNVLSLTSTTTATTSATADGVRLSGLRNGGCRFDDFYVADGGDFLGDCRVQCILPNGNGNSSVLVGSDSNSTDNYLLVNEATASTTEFVESSTVGDKDTYAYGNLTPTTGTVHAVQIVPYAAKTDAGSRSIASVARLSSTEVDSADKVLTSTYTFLPDIRTTKPGGGSWSISDVNDAEFGVKVTA